MIPCSRLLKSERLASKAPQIDPLDDVLVAFDITTVSIDATVSDDGLPSATLTYLWQQLSGPATAVIATPAAEDTTITLPAAGIYEFSLTADDGELSTVRQLRITRQADTGDLVYAINCGGSAYTANDGTVYEADNYHSSGSSYSKNTAISNTEDDTLFQTERYIKAPGTVDYAFPVSNGPYLVTLMWSENTGTGRLMDISAEGQLAIDGLDVIGESAVVRLLMNKPSP